MLNKDTIIVVLIAVDFVWNICILAYIVYSVKPKKVVSPETPTQDQKSNGDVDKDRTIRKLKKEKERLLEKMHEGEILRNGKMQMNQVETNFWSGLGDLETVASRLQKSIAAARAARGNLNLPKDRKSVV